MSLSRQLIALVLTTKHKETKYVHCTHKTEKLHWQRNKLQPGLVYMYLFTTSGHERQRERLLLVRLIESQFQMVYRACTVS